MILISEGLGQLREPISYAKYVLNLLDPENILEPYKKFRGSIDAHTFDIFRITAKLNV